ncbi:MAG: histidine--tRNA ligase [Clostridia bacterium]|nr:histidine--tRNA ligase [Clostridia bacterium]
MGNNENRQIVEPSILAGFMELLPAEQILFNSMLETIRKSYESFGFVPVDTPVIERAEVLLAKSGGDTAKQVYRFNKGDNDLALRFDLTVPLARYVSMHYGELTFPFRRYHIGKVYRGEKPQKGRFREFYQCDIDIVGNGTLSIYNDAEVAGVIYNTFRALDLGDFTIMINNRKLLSGFFQSYGIGDPTEVLRSVDRLDKIGEAGVKKELFDLGLTEEAVAAAIGLASMSGSPANIIAKLKMLGIENELFVKGLEELEAVSGAISAYGVPEEFFKLNLKIARGLDYYTGTVYETFLNAHPELGSICSGGRYDELASNYTKQTLPGVGISIGFSRLFYQLRESGLLGEAGTRPAASTSKVLVVPMDDTVEYALKVAALVRETGIPVETYLNGGKMGKKLGYADKLGIKYVMVCGETEREEGSVMLKDMTTGNQETVKLADFKTVLNIS